MLHSTVVPPIFEIGISLALISASDFPQIDSEFPRNRKQSVMAVLVVLLKIKMQKYPVQCNLNVNIKFVIFSNWKDRFK